MLSILIISFRRKDALLRTLGQLDQQGWFDKGEVIVADNASCDGTPRAVAERFPRARLMLLPSNLGVEAYNRAAELAAGDTLLVLDDDAYPDDGAVEAALEALANDPAVAAVALSPVHPGTREREWAFAGHATDRFPLMGCGNVVRASAWREAGGYDPRFFLYRNDVDLALTLLARGHKVVFDPDRIVWHDSPAVSRKSERWLDLATRNWIWLCRRHGRGFSRLAALVLGTAWAVRHAGLSLSRFGKVVRGFLEGWRSPPRPMVTDGSSLRRLLRLRLGRPPHT